MSAQLKNPVLQHAIQKSLNWESSEAHALFFVDLLSTRNQLIAGFIDNSDRIISSEIKFIVPGVKIKFFLS